MHKTQNMIPRYGIKLGIRVKKVATKARYLLTCIRSLINLNILARRR